MINIYEINEYIYCPRRCWYIRQGINPINSELEEGKMFHNKLKKRKINEVFMSNVKIGTKGKIDYLTASDKITLYELKKGSSRKLWHNDEMQAIAYLSLARKNGLRVDNAFVKYGNGKKFEVKLNKQKETELRTIIKKINDMIEIPPRCTINKCKGCNLKEYCWV